MSRRMKFGSWLATLAFLSLCCPFLLAQYGEAQSDQSKMGNAPVTVTGCLKQGSEKGGYYLMTKDGKIYELSGKADFAKHVGHTVAVAGRETMMSKADEAKMEQHEKMEAGGKPYADLQVTSMKHVSESCGQ
jgi:Protein of unknown function (DUF5818)